MEARIKQAFDKDGSYGLFALFVTGVLRQSIRGWTSTRLEAGGKKPLTESELNAYLGLEIAMSICPLNDIADYWSGERFLGQPGFIETMACDRFQQIRSALQFHAPMPVTFATVRDPLYCCRGLLHHFQKRFAETAVPLGTSSLDEISVRTKARSRARTYMPSKPDKYGLRFYAVVRWGSLYVHSLWDNGSGNVTRSTPAERYTQVFPSLRTPLYNTLSRPEVNIDPKSATALWIAMAGHQTRTFRSPSGRRLLVSDNFYTRHTYAPAVEAFTDGEVRLLGTVRMNLVDRFNKFALEPVIKRIAVQERGEWELVAAVVPESDYKKNAAAHDKKQKKRPKHLQTEYMPTLTYAEHAGYIVFKD
ncbi:unnamed protein product [Phytophthora lilii]|uniref:Unnamed protein product n=1 Tax=Phytophthora lilii TaxID=2077276 RepID=A0A9W6X935_9STRA|nr:unnamed protein product [Phytophthora lilii]